MPPKVTPYGRRLVAVRAVRGWTQKEMARQLGVGARTYQRYEAGERLSGPVKKLIDLLEKKVI